MQVRFDGKEGQLVSWSQFGKITYGIVLYKDSLLRLTMDQLTPIGVEAQKALAS